MDHLRENFDEPVVFRHRPHRTRKPRETPTSPARDPGEVCPTGDTRSVLSGPPPGKSRMLPGNRRLTTDPRKYLFQTQLEGVPRLLWDPPKQARQMSPWHFFLQLIPIGSRPLAHVTNPSLKNLRRSSLIAPSSAQAQPPDQVAIALHIVLAKISQEPTPATNELE